jgi:hypothetical protein
LGVGFRRLVVTRSQSMVWLGALCFAGILALENSVTRGGEFVFATARFYNFWYIVFGLVVVRGLFGAWFSELRVNRDAKLVKTCDGTPVAFEQLGELAVEPTELRAGNVTLYRGGTAEIHARHDALAAMLGRGRLQLYSLQRLAHHTIVPMALFGIAGILAVIGTTYQYIVLDRVHDLEYALIEVSALVVAIAILRYALVGSESENQLRVDPIAGVVQLDDGKIMRFDELGAITLEVHTSFGLKAANRQQYLYLSYRRSHTEKRYNALMTAMLQHALRRALEAPVVEGAAFRGVDIKHEIERITGDSPFKRAALQALTQDPDPTIATRARSLL